MIETYGCCKQYNVCINEIISLYFGVVFGYLTLHGFFVSCFKNNVADQITEG